jgi:hypothetical protein
VPAEASGGVVQGASVLAEAFNSQNPIGRLHSGAVGRKLNAEIPVKYNKWSISNPGSSMERVGPCGCFWGAAS